jgi:hypothetical protein
MSEPKPQHPPAKPPHLPAKPPLRTVINYWGVAILLIGLAGAALVYVFAADDEDAQLAADIARDRMYQHNLELMGGKAAVYMAEFDQWFSGLWHGRPLAYTIAVLAVAIALACFWVTWLMSPPPER